MNRRAALRNVIIFSAGTAVLPSCWQSDKSLVVLKNLSITGSEEKMLAQLSDTILPKTNFIGATDLKAHEFALMMVDDCYAPDAQKVYITGMKNFDKLVESKYGKSFTNCTPAQKKEWLTEVENKQNIPEDVLGFYGLTKKHTLQAFTTSKEYMTDVIKYKMVPGSDFKGCVPLKKV